ncbi:3-hydroxyacyl-CoA dehydrogenase family protein [Agrococcus sp. HG114]|uniref:3-hydroxyacyl-CoA dehydrogenase family protein n=1 Tax=Agrococcus sp. HG114 TaxID=2969757 RepID=UPI00215AB968|nr:3-hydroxyacyl-CoA dehydrogenase family protein [Agrococcus sp. HG114]MCR8671274.1 3-hydroxyacyl-CoA dehydrogenase family protein [Agrococcus sp. HG114]
MESIAVLGAGIMGAGIARVLGRAGHDVRVFDVRADAAARAAESAGGSPCDSVEAAVDGATIVLEAAPERLELKRALLAEVEAANREAIIASNTSSIDVAALAAGMRDPSRLVIAHFFNPADTVPLVEVVPGPATPQATVDRMVALLAEAGKAPVALAEQVEGFIANRLQAALYREAMHLVERGVATPEQVDAVVTAGLGPRWALAGPFEVMDLGGLDVWTSVTDGIFPTLSGASAAPAMLRERAASGELGAKSGQGFFAHDADAPVRFAARLAALLEARVQLDATDPALEGRGSAGEGSPT